MTSLFASLLAAALSAATAVSEPGPNATDLQYSVQFDEATGSAALACQASSTGSCTFWVGDAAGERHAADGRGTLVVGGAPAIVRVKAANPGYCASPSEQLPPRWPECTHGPLGGALDRSANVDYRRD